MENIFIHQGNDRTAIALDAIHKTKQGMKLLQGVS